jgi:uncharacterized membrane protein
MHTERGFDRLVNFSDAVVAIAITLLILPLVDTVTELAEGESVIDLLVRDQSKFVVFIISFVVIGRFWMVHHRVYEQAIGYNPQLLWANLAWLLTIVFLPFPTELIADNSGPATATTYVGTMLATSLTMGWQHLILIRHPELQAPEVRGTLSLTPSIVTVALMLVTLLAVIVFPDLGLWGLFILLLTAPVHALVRRAQRRGARPSAGRGSSSGGRG